MSEILSLLFVLVKALLMVTVAVLVRIFHEQEHITMFVVFKRVLTGVFIYFIAITILTSYMELDDQLAGAIAAAMAFASREVLELYLSTLKKGVDIRTLIKRK